MSYQLTLRAARDLAEAVSWYEQQSKAVAASFIGDIDAIIATICERPTSYPRATQRSRKARCRVFPYCIYFRIEKTTPVIMSVYHTSRDPAKWRDRG